MERQRKKILVADCHEDGLIVLEKLLEDAGFDTTTVWTAKEALRLVESHVFDLVLLSKYLPDSECDELLKVLRKRGEIVTCVVMLPSEPEMTDFINLETSGARDVVCKHAYKQVLETVRECLAYDKKSRSAA
ncbi:MAG TPA: response regulator [Candidatus Sulfotelmatobacter sp.]|nr:response regulator [Candidatus Sulfotelmatobacter sp.]